MDIQWMIFAKGFTENKDSTLSILGIFHHVNLNLLPDKKCSMLLIAKVKPEISEIGEYKDIELKIEHIGSKWSLKRNTRYKVHNLSTWVKRIPYLIIPIRDLELPHSGEYVFRLFVGNEFKNEESITVSI
jgi:hypothetical protein